MHAHLLEDGAARAVLARPSAGAAAQLVGPPGAGGAHQHAAALRQDHLRVHVRSGHDVRGTAGRVKHLFDMQTHFTEAAAQRAEVLQRDGRAQHGRVQLQGHPPEHGRDGAPGARRRQRRAHRQLVPEQGACCSVLCCDVLC